MNLAFAIGRLPGNVSATFLIFISVALTVVAFVISLSSQSMDECSGGRERYSNFQQHTHSLSRLKPAREAALSLQVRGLPIPQHYFRPFYTDSLDEETTLLAFDVVFIDGILRSFLFDTNA